MQCRRRHWLWCRPLGWRSARMNGVIKSATLDRIPARQCRRTNHRCRLPMWAEPACHAIGPASAQARNAACRRMTPLHMSDGLPWANRLSRLWIARSGGTVIALVLDSRVPPAAQKDDMVCRSHGEANAGRLRRQDEQVETRRPCLERIHRLQPLAFRHFPIDDGRPDVQTESRAYRKGVRARPWPGAVHPLASGPRPRRGVRRLQRGSLRLDRQRRPNRIRRHRPSGPEQVLGMAHARKLVGVIKGLNESAAR